LWHSNFAGPAPNQGSVYYVSRWISDGTSRFLQYSCFPFYDNIIPCCDKNHNKSSSFQGPELRFLWLFQGVRTYIWKRCSFHSEMLESFYSTIHFSGSSGQAASAFRFRIFFTHASQSSVISSPSAGSIAFSNSQRRRSNPRSLRCVRKTLYCIL